MGTKLEGTNDDRGAANNQGITPASPESPLNGPKLSVSHGQNQMLGGAEPCGPNNDGIPEEEKLVYRHGICALRSSAHRVRYSEEKSRRHGTQPKESVSSCTGKGKTTNLLPPSIRAETILRYDASAYDLEGAVISMLRVVDPQLVGSWDESSEVLGDNRLEDFRVRPSNPCRLEGFRVPPPSLSRGKFGGQCEAAQRYLSEIVASNEPFLCTFDRFLKEVVLPALKARLISCGLAKRDVPIAFYYQRPPTLRLQPGPARAHMKVHRDADYGHQPGELNYWAPLTDPDLTGVDLWTESKADVGDYHPLGVRRGEIASFHGTSCRHYVPRNASLNTRASIDFRVGVEGFFDPVWQMLGTKDDHNRREVKL